MTEGTAGYWDLILGARPDRPSPWPSPRSPARRRAWLEWRDRIKARWPRVWSHGRRPAAWWTFDAPLRVRRLTEEEVARIRGMTNEELVYLLDAGPSERRDIEGQWQCDIAIARHRYPDNPARCRAHATRDLDVPGWYYDLVPSTPSDRCLTG